MSIDLSKVTAMSDQYGPYAQIADASGRVLWSSTIKFTINGDTYIADRGMTWAEWFASDYNTTGKTADDVQSISANGAAVEISAVIVGGTAYEVGFGHPVVISISDNYQIPLTATLNGEVIAYSDERAAYFTTESSSMLTLEADCSAYPSYTPKIYLNDELVASGSSGGQLSYDVDLANATHIMIFHDYEDVYIYTQNIVAKQDVTITVTGTGAVSNSYGGYITHNGTSYSGSSTFNAKTGDVIYCHAAGSGESAITYNKKYVHSGYDPVEFYLIVGSDTTIALSYQNYYGYKGAVKITDANA